MKTRGIISLQGLITGLCLVLALLAPAVVHAAVFTVTSTQDEVDTNLGDGACLTAEGSCSLRAAVQEANALAGNDTIIVPAGVFLLAIPGTGENNAVSGDLDITGDNQLLISGAGKNATIVDGNALDRVFDIRGSGAVTVSGLTLRNGKTEANGTGGGLAVGANANLSLHHVTVTGNSADRAGGGIANESGLVDLNNVAITDNSSLGGGGIYNAQNGVILYSLGVVSGNHDRGIWNRGSIKLTNISISDNVTTGNGAGLDNDGGTAELQNVTIDRNTAPQENNSAGGLRNAGSAAVTNTILSNNSPNNCGTTAVISRGNNLSSDPTCGLAAAGDLVNKPALIAPLALNGGDLETAALRPGSPAIDAGTPAGCPSTDARGIGRAIDGNGDGLATCDMGAFEFRPRKITATPPPDLSFGTISVGASSNRTVTVRNNGDENLILSALTPPVAPFSLTADTCSSTTLASGRTCSFTLRFSPVDAVTSSSSVGIPSNDPVMPLVTYSLSGTGATGPVPDISITDSLGPADDLLVDFGGVTIGTAQEATITVSNTGTGDLVLGSVAGTDPLSAPFSLSNDTCSGRTLVPSDSCTLRVRFAPDGNVLAVETFDIPNNDPDALSATVSVKGSGISDTGNTPPSAPVLLSPANGSSVSGSSVTFSWKRSVDPDGETMTHRFFHCADPSFTGCQSVDAATGHAQAFASGGLGAGLAFLAFIVGSGIPGPRKRMLFLALFLYMGFFFVACGGGGKSGTPETPITPPSDNMSYQVTGLSPGTTYYWKIVADDGDGSMSSSETWSYTTH